MNLSCETVIFYHTEEDITSRTVGPSVWTYRGVKLSQIVARGYLHVLKYFHEELNYQRGLQRYVRPAIKYGQLDILNWLHENGFMEEEDDLLKFDYDPYKKELKRFIFCDYAVKCGNVQALEWLINHGYAISTDSTVLIDAIRSKSLEMIRYCFNNYDFNRDYYKTSKAIIASRNVEVYRLFHELGFEFKYTISEWISENCADFFDIIKFLRSISVPWDDTIMGDIVKYGTLEMLLFAYNDRCPWTARGDEYKCLFSDKGYQRRDGSIKNNFQDFDKLQYLISNGCIFDHEHFSDEIKLTLIEVLRSRKDIKLLDFFVGKDSSFDNMLLEYFVGYSFPGELWLEGLTCLKEKVNNVQN